MKKYTKQLSRFNCILSMAMAVTARADPIIEPGVLNGWWRSILIKDGDGIAQEVQYYAFRRYGKMYALNKESCRVLFKIRENIEDSGQPGTLRTVDLQSGRTGFYTYLYEDDKLHLTFYSDSRKHSQAPSASESDSNVYRTISTRIPNPGCAEPEPNFPNEPAIQAPYSFDKTKSPFWSEDCDNFSKNYWFIMDERPDRRHPIYIGNAIKAIPFPGLHDIENVYKDEKIKWITQDEVSIANPDKDMGWTGTKTFYRCAPPK
ncbi:MAG: hypothetical protein ABW076_13560 [Candidatus Thiodiazotropha sp.]